MASKAKRYIPGDRTLHVSTLLIRLREMFVGELGTPESRLEDTFSIFGYPNQTDVLDKKSKSKNNVSGDKRQRSWLRHYAASRKVAGSIPDEVIGLFFVNLPNPPSRNMALRSTLPLMEMSTRNLPGWRGGKGRPACKADNLTAICEPTV
jgi:hypothetical protein